MGDRLRRMSAALTLRCALGGILALVLLHFGLAAEGLVGPLARAGPRDCPGGVLRCQPALLTPWHWPWAGPSCGTACRACGAVPAWRRCPRWPLVLPCCRPRGPAERQELSAVQLHPSCPALRRWNSSLRCWATGCCWPRCRADLALAQAAPERRGAFRAKDKGACPSVWLRTWKKKTLGAAQPPHRVGRRDGGTGLRPRCL